MALAFLLAAFVAGLGMGGYGMSSWDEAKVARHEKAVAVAQAKVDEQAKQAVTAANDEIRKMQLAFDAGRAKARVVTNTINTKGEQYAAATPTLRSPQCFIGPDGVSVIADQASALQLAAAASVLGLSVSSAVYTRQGVNVGGGTVPPVSAQPANAGGVSLQLQQLRGADEGAGQAATGLRRPKPKPVE